MTKRAAPRVKCRRRSIGPGGVQQGACSLRHDAHHLLPSFQMANWEESLSGFVEGVRREKRVGGWLGGGAKWGRGP